MKRRKRVLKEEEMYPEYVLSALSEFREKTGLQRPCERTEMIDLWLECLEKARKVARRKLWKIGAPVACTGQEEVRQCVV